MKLLRRPLPVVLLAGLLLVGAFFSSAAVVRAGPDTNELTVRILELTMLRNKFNWFNDRADLQLYVIVSDGVLPLNSDPNAAKWAWPVAGGPASWRSVRRCRRAMPFGRRRGCRN